MLVYVSVKSMPFFTAARLMAVFTSFDKPEFATLAAAPVRFSESLKPSVFLLAPKMAFAALSVFSTIFLIWLLYPSISLNIAFKVGISSSFLRQLSRLPLFFFYPEVNARINKSAFSWSHRIISPADTGQYPRPDMKSLQGEVCVT